MELAQSEVNNLDATSTDTLVKIAPKVYRCGKIDQNTVFIAMDFAGHRLKDHITSKLCPKTRNKRLELLQSIIEPVKILHDQEIGHCDLKYEKFDKRPQNW